MTKEERAELTRIRRERGRDMQEEQEREEPAYKDEKTHKKYAFRLLGWEVKIVKNTNK